MDYYEILKLDRNSANHEDIAASFRKLALESHPMRNIQGNLSGNQRQFSQVCEAYEVLSNQDRKECYDKFGLDGLKDGKPTAKEEGKTVGGYEF